MLRRSSRRIGELRIGQRSAAGLATRAVFDREYVPVVPSRRILAVRCEARFAIRVQENTVCQCYESFSDARSGDLPTDITGGPGSGRARDRGVAIRVSFAAAPGWWNW